MTRANPTGLSDAEVEVLALLAEGLRNAEISGRLVDVHPDGRPPRVGHTHQARRANR
jgi:hypothetical protein